jgi:NAD(P)-dependent dehydrogenase (short-subunit alcohol dehydrogenase family)
MAGGNEKPLALITGGHRRLGGAIAAHLADAGYALALHGSHDVDLDDSLLSAIERNATPWKGFAADFTDAVAASHLIASVTSTFGRAPDLLVNSAALFGQDTLENVSAADLVSHYSVICVAPVLLTQAFAGQSASSFGGHSRCIINILDQRLSHPHGDQLAYTLAKQALAGFTQLSARTLAPHIRVNAVAPGLTIATADYDEPQLARLSQSMPLARLPQPDQIAEAVLYLAQASAVTGQVIAVDSGAHMMSYERDFMHM